MKTNFDHSFASFGIGLFILTAGWAPAEIINRNFNGVTTFNLTEGAINEEFPVGTPWKAVVAWDSSSAPLFLNETQAQYRLTQFTLSFQGANGKWTTSSRTDQATFTLNHVFGGTQHEMQFNSGWGPTNHTNATIGNYQPYSINIALKDPTGKAIPTLDAAPTSIDPSLWDAEESYFKIYLSNEGNRFISGSINLPAAKQAEISVQQPAGSELVDGATRRNLGIVKVGSKGATKSYVIHNTGNAPLTGLAVTKTGGQSGDFLVGPLSATTLAPGAKARFTVVFKPKGKGKRAASLHIASNDSDENPFDIQLVGVGR